MDMLILLGRPRAFQQVPEHENRTNGSKVICIIVETFISDYFTLKKVFIFGYVPWKIRAKIISLFRIFFIFPFSTDRLLKLVSRNIRETKNQRTLALCKLIHLKNKLKVRSYDRDQFFFSCKLIHCEKLGQNNVRSHGLTLNFP